MESPTNDDGFVVERLQAQLNCAEGRMQRPGWICCTWGYKWGDLGRGVGRHVLVKVRRGFRSNAVFMRPHVERILFTGAGLMRSLPFLEADTLLEAIEAAERWLKEGGRL